MNAFDKPAFADGFSRRLRSITNELMSCDENVGRLREAAKELYSLFSLITGVGDDSNHPNCSCETQLASGKAISPKDAARCALDPLRTYKFIKGLGAAILEARRRFPDTTIEILYAGCGPFATLAIPLTTMFGPAEIQFTLLDIHKRSIEAARHIFHVLGLSAYVRNYIQCDAASYRHDTRQAIHIVLTETMQTALEKEPQVAITMNLAPQIRPGGILIPERVAVDACLLDLNREMMFTQAEADDTTSSDATCNKRRRIHLGRLLELTAESCRDQLEVDYRDGRRVLTGSRDSIFSVPMDAVAELHLTLLTTITVFDSIALSDYDCGITYPKVFYEAGKLSKGARIEFTYCMENNPGFGYRFV